MSLFQGSTDKELPKNINDCVKPDKVSKCLWAWASRIETWGYIIFWLLIIAGIVGAISDFLQANEVLDESECIPILITSLLTNGLIAFLEFCAYNAVALLIGALASIVHNTNITANLAIYNTEPKSGDVLDERVMITMPETSNSTSGSSESFFSKLSNASTLSASPAGMKRCPVCKNNIPVNTNFCKYCGSPIGNTVKTAQSTNTWTCPNCKTEHPNYVGSCGCGQPKPQ